MWTVTYAAGVCRGMTINTSPQWRNELKLMGVWEILNQLVRQMNNQRSFGDMLLSLVCTLSGFLSPIVLDLHWWEQLKGIL